MQPKRIAAITESKRCDVKGLQMKRREMDRRGVFTDEEDEVLGDGCRHRWCREIDKLCIQKLNI